MSFKKMKSEDLVLVATEDFNLDLPENATKPVALAALVEAGVTWEKAVEVSPTVEAYDGMFKQQEVEKLAVEPVIQEEGVPVQQTEVRPQDVVATTKRPAKTLVKMVRDNPSFQIRGYKFTQENPFVLVTEEDAEYLVDLNDGFYYATPKEAQEFYS